MKRILAFDFGASSGRAMLGTLENGKIELKEIHRFPNEPVLLNGTLYWDVLRLFHEVKQGIIKAKNDGGFDAIGIDTWGVDFGLLDEKGNLLANPVHYRDVRTQGIMAQVAKIIPDEELYRQSGLQFMNFNTIYQLYALKTQSPELLERAESLLFMPDLFAYFLTGKKRTEYTIASTSALLKQTGEVGFNGELMEKLGLPNLFAPVIMPGESYGNLSSDIAAELDVKPVPVIAVCTHDTASAIAAVPSNDENKVYISSGTWSLFGTELKTPVTSATALKNNFTNERGYAKSVRFLKNIMGLWLIQECRRAWRAEGEDLGFGQIADLAEKSELKAIIDVDDERFLGVSNMPETIKGYCKEKGLAVPQTKGEVARVVYESLAKKYSDVLKGLEEVTGKKYSSINVLGGGCNADLLNRLVAKYCGVKVYTGPVEATAIGNVIVQLIAIGEIKDLQTARDIVKQSFEIKEYNA